MCYGFDRMEPRNTYNKWSEKDMDKALATVKVGFNTSNK